jgi:hypothetical protein
MVSMRSLLRKSRLYVLLRGGVLNSSSVVIFKLINSQSRVMKSVNPGVPKMSYRLSGSYKVVPIVLSVQSCKSMSQSVSNVYSLRL